MPAAVASRARGLPKDSTASRDPRPPAKKTKLSQPARDPPQSGLKALLNGTPNAKKTAVATANGAKNGRKDRVDETRTVVGGGLAGHGDVDMKDAGNQIIEISSEEEQDSSSDEDEDDNDDAGAAAQINGELTPASNGVAHDEELVEDGAVEPEELSFADRLQAQEPVPARTPNVVDVDASFAGPSAEPQAFAAVSSSRPLSAPSASSLGTVLTQALRTNDQDLLESCLRVVDVDTVYATVERLPSPLVGSLLQKLAERLHKRPGRAGMLMIWVQWSLAAHGGYLASQPQLVKQLATLNKVLKARASGLQPLLSLKGRLDMLHAQLELRKRNQRRNASIEEEEAVIYVEGEDESSSEDEDEEESDSHDGAKRKRQDFDDVGTDSSADEMPSTMEVDEADSEDDSDDSEDLLDDEAEETDNDTGDDMSEPLSDEDILGGEEGSGSEDDSKPARRSTVGRAGLPRRY